MNRIWTAFYGLTLSLLASLPLPVAAQMVPGISGPMMMQKARPTVAFQYSSLGSGTSATQTFTSVPFGAEGPNRLIAVQVAGNRSVASALAISSVTIGGVSASVLTDGTTQATTNLIAGNNRVVMAIWIAAVPTGTSGTVTVVFNAALASGSATVGVYSIYNASITARSVGVQRDVDPAVTTVTSNNTSAIIAVAQSSAITWTNASADYSLSGAMNIAGATNANPFPNSTQVTAAGSVPGVTGIVAASFNPI